jgi:isocitrate dehydrogenase kinase/phosphatase
MTRNDPPSQPGDPAAAGAGLIAEGFRRYLEEFRDLTLGARSRFEKRDWPAVQQASRARLDLYGAIVARTVEAVRGALGERALDRSVWGAIRSVYPSLPAAHSEPELAETFFNSNVRRVFHTVGVDPAVEFVEPGALPSRHGPPWSFTRTHWRTGSLQELLARALREAPFAAPWDDLEGDAARAAAALAGPMEPGGIEAIELVRSPFFRGKGAYLAGQIHARGRRVPLLLALRNPRGRLLLDAALFTEEEFSVVFSFAHSYFFVELDRPREMIDFLSSLLPLKPIPDLWSSVGFHRHAKTGLYRMILQHLAGTTDRFQMAPGQRGLVMVVFALPGLDVVFKVIRDRFPPPKTVTHEEVRERYRLVFHHDRAGRLVDAQEFEFMEFPEERFEPGLLKELATSASESVAVRDGRVVLRHLYTERRLVPLDLYLQTASPVEARGAVFDYGQVLRDLAATNIFPGDMLIKNFGVSRHGRLIFYDYDELCLLTDCRFRDLPRASSAEEEVAAEPWYFVGERDIFPEEFRAFLGLHGELLEGFLESHGELLEPGFWRRMQELHRRGVLPDIYPYPASRRLRPDGARWDTH